MPRVTSLDALADELRAEGGQLADHVRAPAPDALTPAADALRAGPRTADRADEYGLLVEAIREGELLHYGDGRVLATDDPDLALLAGDRLYALGLDRLARLGDVDAVAALATVIAGCARAYADGRPQEAAQAWQTGLGRIAGAPDGH